MTFYNSGIIPLSEIATMKSGPKSDQNDGEKVSIDEEKVSIDEEKVSIEFILKEFENRRYKKCTVNNILRIYSEFGKQQAFGAPEIEKLLGCSSTASKRIVKKLRDMQAITPVKGKGKGKYRFVNKDELLY